MAGLAQRASIGWVIFGVAAVVALALSLIGSRHTTFSGDELGMLFRLADQDLHKALLEPPAGKYLIAFPTLVYGALGAIFGAGSYVPYRILGALLVALAAGLFYALARRRAPEPLALGCSVLLLFFGAAAEVIAIPGRVPGQIAICAGLGILLALDRADLRGDLIACALGVVALGSHPIGLAFVAAGAVVLVAGRRWPSLWVVLIPILLYGLWWATLRAPGEEFTATFEVVTTFARDAFIAVCAALTGIFRSPWVDGVDFFTTASRVIALIAVIGGLVAIVRARRVSVGLAAALVGLAVGLAGPALGPGGLAFGFRNPDADRYLYPGAILTLLVLVEIAALRRNERGRSTGTVAIAAVGAAVFVIAMASNVAALVSRASDYRVASDLVSASVGAFELAREDRSPSERAAELDETLERSAGWLALMLQFDNPDEVEKVIRGAPAYYEINDAYGFDPFEQSVLDRASPAVIAQMDRLLVASYPLALAPAASAPRRCDGPSAAGEPVRSAGGPVLVTAPAPNPPTVTVGRFSGFPVQPVVWPAEARKAVLELPETEPGSPPWVVGVAGPASVRQCPASDVRPD